MAPLTSTVRSYPATFGGLLLACLLTVGFGVAIAGCQPKVESILKPGTKVDAAGLSGEAVQEQAALDKEGHALEQQLADYQTKASAFNTTLQARQTQLAAAQQQRAAILQAAGGIFTSLATGHLDPVGLAGTGLSLIGLLGGAGAMADKSARVSIVQGLRSQITNLNSQTTSSGDAPPVTPGIAAAATPAAPPTGASTGPTPTV